MTRLTIKQQVRLGPLDFRVDVRDSVFRRGGTIEATVFWWDAWRDMSSVGRMLFGITMSASDTLGNFVQLVINNKLWWRRSFPEGAK